MNIEKKCTEGTFIWYIKVVENEPGQACLVLLLPRIFACFVVLPLLLQNNFGWSWEKIRVILMHYKKKFC